jgi:hypothetical protein
MNKILLKRRRKTLRFLPLNISKSDEDMLKFATHWKKEMTKMMGVPIVDSEPRCPISDAANRYNCMIPKNRGMDGWSPTDIKMFQMAFGLRVDGIFGHHTKMMYRRVKDVHNLNNHREVMLLVKERLSVKDCPNIKQPNTI